MIVNSSFRPLWWLSNRHAQTLYPTLVKKRLKPRIDFHERLELPDGDFIDLAWSVNELNKIHPWSYYCMVWVEELTPSMSVD